LTLLKWAHNVRMERYEVIAYKGFFIGIFSRSSPEGFRGCADICTERPASHRDAVPIESVKSLGAYPEEERAVGAARHQAQSLIDNLAPNWDPFTSPGSLGKE
jgi:hypothetical protein